MRASATARKRRWLPQTFVRRSAAASRDGWIAQARWTTASAPRSSERRSSSLMSASAHSVLGNSTAGRLLETPSTDSTVASSASAVRRLVPTLPLAPTMTTLIASRLEQDLDAAVLLFLEQLVRSRSLLQGQLVGGQILGPERIVVSEQGEKVVHPALDVRLSHAKRHALVEEIEHRQRVGLAAVDADQRDRAAAPDRGDGGSQRGQPVHPDPFGQRGADPVGKQARRRLQELGDRRAV